MNSLSQVFLKIPLFRLFQIGNQRFLKTFLFAFQDLLLEKEEKQADSQVKSLKIMNFQEIQMIIVKIKFNYEIKSFGKYYKMLSEQKLEQYQQKEKNEEFQQCRQNQQGQLVSVEEEKRQKKQKKWRIPHPDEVFSQLEMQKVLESIPVKKKVEQNIANLAALMNYQIVQQSRRQTNQMLMESERRQTMSIRQQLGSNNQVKAIIFQKNQGFLYEDSTGPQFPADLSVIRQSVESNTETEYKIEKMVQKQMAKNQNFSKNKQKIAEQHQIQQLLPQKTYFQVIVAACLARTLSISEYRKYKIQLDDDSLIINKKFVIPFQSITKVKIISQLIRPQLKITFLQKKSKLLKGKKAKQERFRSLSIGNILEESEDEEQKKIKKDGKFVEEVLLLCDGYELIYTIFASIIVRKLKKTGMLIPQPIKVNTFLMKAGISQSYNVSGKILKLSRHLKKWEQRFGEIKDFQYMSSRVKGSKNEKMEKSEKSVQVSRISSKIDDQENKLNIGKCTLKIKKIKELWTRFETHQGKLVVKFFYSRQKYELGIPLHNYADILGEGNWLYGLVTILRGCD